MIQQDQELVYCSQLTGMRDFRLQSFWDCLKITRRGVLICFNYLDFSFFRFYILQQHGCITTSPLLIICRHSRFPLASMVITPGLPFSVSNRSFLPSPLVLTLKTGLSVVPFRQKDYMIMVVDVSTWDTNPRSCCRTLQTAWCCLTLKTQFIQIQYSCFIV